MIVCTFPILLIIFLSDFATIITSIIALTLEIEEKSHFHNDDCKNLSAFFIVCMVLYTFTLTIKIAIISIQYKNIKRL